MKNKYHIMVAATALAALITINLKAQDTTSLLYRYNIDTSLNRSLLIDTLRPVNSGYVIDDKDTMNYGGYFSTAPNIRAPWDTMRMGYYQEAVPIRKYYPSLEDGLLPSLIKRGDAAARLNNTNAVTQLTEESIYDKILSSGNTYVVILNPSSPPIIVVANKRKLKKLLRTFL